MQDDDIENAIESIWNQIEMLEDELIAIEDTMSEDDPLYEYSLNQWGEINRKIKKLEEDLDFYEGFYNA